MLDVGENLFLFSQRNFIKQVERRKGNQKKK
jgi:hypothetical protein